MLGFKKDRKPSKGINHKKRNRLAYKCTHYKRVDYLNPFCFNKLNRSKGNNLRSSTTYAHGPKKMWAPYMKP